MHIRKSERGFSMLETVIVVAITLILAAVASLSVIQALKTERSESGFQWVKQEVQKARGLAIKGRTVYVLTFTSGSSSSVALSTVTPGSLTAGAAIETIPLPKGYQFAAVSGIPTAAANVPDGYGKSTPLPIDLDQANGVSGYTYIYFYPDGSAHNASGQFSGGIVYFADPNDVKTSHALSLIGYTGRVAAWRLVSTAGGYIWRTD